MCTCAQLVILELIFKQFYVLINYIRALVPDAVLSVYMDINQIFVNVRSRRLYISNSIRVYD
eukprot:UN14522